MYNKILNKPELSSPSLVLGIYLILVFYWFSESAQTLALFCNNLDILWARIIFLPSTSSLYSLISSFFCSWQQSFRTCILSSEINIFRIWRGILLEKLFMLRKIDTTQSNGKRKLKKTIIFLFSSSPSIVF